MTSTHDPADCSEEPSEQPFDLPDDLLAAKSKVSEDERLLDLFWNRADLKKRFSGLKSELHAKDDAIAEQQAAIDRIRAEKRALENALADTSSAFPTMAYYHLRGLWFAAHKHLVHFCEELCSQQHDRERKKQIMEFNREREVELAELGKTIAATKAEADAAKTELTSLEAELAGMNGMFSLLQRKKMEPVVENQRAYYEEVRGRIEALFDKRIKLESRPWPEKNDLSVEGKRVINLAIVAMAQHLYLHFCDNGLGQLARTTTLKKFDEMEFGTREDCEFIVHRVRDAVRSMKNERGFAAPLRERSKYLRSIAVFRNAGDTVPSAGSIGQVQTAVPGTELGLGNTVAGVPHDVNILVDDYWGVGDVLLR
jgi:predicted  nucleic acid-binding Zn-ribbon protein